MSEERLWAAWMHGLTNFGHEVNDFLLLIYSTGLNISLMHDQIRSQFAVLTIRSTSFYVPGQRLDLHSEKELSDKSTSPLGISDSGRRKSHYPWTKEGGQVKARVAICRPILKTASLSPVTRSKIILLFLYTKGCDRYDHSHCAAVWSTATLLRNLPEPEDG